jgi:hypothetical protein
VGNPLVVIATGELASKLPVPRDSRTSTPQRTGESDVELFGGAPVDAPDPWNHEWFLYVFLHREA